MKTVTSGKVTSHYLYRRVKKLKGTYNNRGNKYNGELSYDKFEEIPDITEHKINNWRYNETKRPKDIT